MKTGQLSLRAFAWLLIVLLAAPPAAIGQQSGSAPVVKQEELDQLLAPIALYPDSLVSQILMASTYPLEIVQADRFAKQNKNLKGDTLTATLEKQTWDPSVKSLVNFPQVLAMMSDKLDWTQKLGDAFIAHQKAVMDTIQNLRAKAQAAGNLKSTNEQKVIVEEKIIRIEPASPQVVYVPVYNPTVVYGVWAYPAYPPYYYYPPGYTATAAAFTFTAGVAMGAAWGYAWGNSNWSGGSVDYNVNQNININNSINRQNYAQQLPAQAGQGNWQHNASHRKGVPYSNQALAEKYNQATPAQQAQARQAYRGHTGSALTPQEQQQAQQRAQQAQQQQTTQQGQQQQRAQQAQQTQQARGASGGSDSRGGAFEGIDRGGSSARSASQRGSASRSSFSGGGGRSGRGRSGGGRR